MEIIKVKKLHPQAKVPKKATKGSAFFDLYSLQDISLVKGKFVMARTGLAFEIPEGYFVETRVRSSVAKNGVIIPNAPTVIDSDYRGEILVPLYGLFCNFVVFCAGSRIAQARLVKIDDCEFQITTELSKTDRGVGGFGSTNK